MNYIPRRAAIVTRNAAEADFTESTIASYGFEVTRHDSATGLASELKRQLASGETGAAFDLAVLAGSTSAIDDDDVASLTEVVPVVIASENATVAEAVELVKNGAKDVVELPCSSEELWSRVSSVLDECNAEAAAKSVRAEMASRMELLTPAEVEVVHAMLDGLANKQIAQRLGIGLRTVELRRSKIMRKMQAKSVAELVKFICQSGKLSTPEAEERPESAEG